MPWEQCRPAVAQVTGTGTRRSEALALRWRDIDLDVDRLAVRRSVGAVKAEGAGEELIEGPTKTGRARVVALHSGSVAHCAPTGRLAVLAVDLVQDPVLVLSNPDGSDRHPERLPAVSSVRSSRLEALGEERLR
ncbi:hypothetical protein [Blastococcus montanus]|uniref:hypothetical protein n=1 Tax=Blastococcus montanus TaxID=3144973 RepID=UPI0032091310